MKIKKPNKSDLLKISKITETECIILPQELYKRIKELLIEVNFILCDNTCENLDLIKKSEKILYELGVYKND